MLSLFQNRDYAFLFGAQVVALIGTGLLTVALGLLAYDFAGDRAGLVLGTAYTIKMVAYVGLSPIAQAVVQRLPRKAVLIGTDLIRAGVALCLPFVTDLWQVYGLIFVLQAASATFTPAYQAVLPDVLPEERDYTRALSLSRMAYDLENLTSPALAGLLLTVMSYHWLFLGTVAGFVGSALLVAVSVIPALRGPAAARPFRERLSRGLRIYLATPRLRGLLALNLAAASVGAFVLVNTVVMVRGGYGAGETGLAIAMAAFGAGSMAAALVLPRLLDHLPDRRVMMAGARGLIAVALVVGTLVWLDGLPAWGVFLLVWAAIGFLYSSILMPSGRLLRRSAHAEDRPAIFAAQFALSHACWLLTYPLAGWAGQAMGMGPALMLLAGVAVVGLAVASRHWPDGLPDAPEHDHPDLPEDHPHLRANGGRRHTHAFVIDDEHRVWPIHG
ncbi:Predicted arabinose efflux permease, MFS family [Roseovarius tolerans]|uniref:Predicted arabinose efflux permease, MFS family n=1 Tax=Roseovarius tolerans TaxID=74031 RepID=A0A1H7Z6R0_9RHOB|nr:MFS transporter [Roseovarius tolerans]SEM53248.1 Predicted arabinose efflux permease, MFS family [Roseovarius tolerans]